jgi:hypothetical protein
MEEPDTATTRDLLYKEYVRLHEKMDAYANASFADFKLLAVVGAGAGLIVKLSHATKLTNPDGSPFNSAFLAPLLAFASLGLVAILAFRDLLRQSVLYGLVPHLKALEAEIRKRFALEDTQVFLVNTSIPTWRRTHVIATRAFGVAFLLVIAGLPAVVMLRETSEVALGIAYVITALLFFGAYTWVGDKVITTVMNAKLRADGEKATQHNAST